MQSQALRSQVGTALAASLFAPFGFVPEARAQESAEGLEEIVVTARRREENLQTVPLAITAFSGESLQARGVDMISNMNAMAPNLSVQGGQGREMESTAAFRVRGVPGVAVYVDGIDQTSAIGLFTMGIVEVDRIEVLRGPQGTLFGNSALGGAVHYVTRRPADHRLRASSRGTPADTARRSARDPYEQCPGRARAGSRFRHGPRASRAPSLWA